MPLIQRPMVDRDIYASHRVQEIAFSGDLGPLFFPQGKTDAAREYEHKKALKGLHHEPTHRYMVVVDTDAVAEEKDVERLSEAEKEVVRREGRVVGTAFWKVYEKDRSDAEVEAEEEKGKEDGFPPGFNIPLGEAFFGAMGKAKKEQLGGRRHVLLHILATDPAFHRRGIGAMQLKWGLDEADRLGVEAYLEASQAGRPLYERWGFKVIKPLDFDSREWGTEKNIGVMLMLRPVGVHGTTNGNGVKTS